MKDQKPAAKSALIQSREASILYLMKQFKASRQEVLEAAGKAGVSVQRIAEHLQKMHVENQTASPKK